MAPDHDLDRSRVRHYVARTSALVESVPPATRTETRTWLVDPLLEALDWDLRSETNLQYSAVTIADTHLEYVLAVDRTPALFVAVDPFADSCSTRREDGLRRAMAATGVDRAIYTNGRTIVLLAGAESAVSASEIDRFQCRQSAVADAIDHLRHVSRNRLQERFERELADARPEVLAARRLALECERDREGLTSTIVDELVDRTGGRCRSELAFATEQFLDELVEGFRSLSADSSATAGETTTTFDDRSPSTSSSRRQSSSPDRGSSPASSSAPTTDRDSPDAADESDGDDSPIDRERVEDAIGGGESSDGTDGADDGQEEEDEDGEYVVRFFGDRGSIGAVGHSRSDGAMVAAAEFLFEHGLSGIRTPWQPDSDGASRSEATAERDDSTAVTLVHDEPVTVDGAPMSEYEQLSNGYYLNTAGTPDQRATRLEALAERAGLRVMFTGDWPSSRR